MANIYVFVGLAAFPQTCARSSLVRSTEAPEGAGHLILTFSYAGRGCEHDGADLDKTRALHRQFRP